MELDCCPRSICGVSEGGYASWMEQATTKLQTVEYAMRCVAMPGRSIHVMLHMRQIYPCNVT